MILDTLMIGALIGGALYSAACLDVTHYPLLYPEDNPPSDIIVVILAVNLGRYLSKLQFAIQNRPSTKIIYPVLVCALNCGFIITSLRINMYIGFCLIGVLSETGTLLKWLHYLPRHTTTTRWFSAMIGVKFFVTFLAKGVFAMALSSLACVIQYSAVLNNVHYTTIVPFTAVALILMTLNFVHMVTFTTFTMEHFKDKPGKKFFSSGASISGRGLNHCAMITTKKPICYVNNAIHSDTDYDAVKNTHAFAVNGPVKEKNCNVDIEKQQYVGDYKKLANNEQTKSLPKNIYRKVRM